MSKPQVPLRLCPQALLLQDEAYATMRDTPHPFTSGLALILTVGIMVALTAIVGTTLEWATTPDLVAVKESVFRGIQQMDWYQEASQRSPDFEATFRLRYDRGWRIFPYLFGAPSLPRAIAGVVTTPLWLVTSWLAFGLLGHASARILGGQARLRQTLGCTALAVAPQLLKLARLLPYVEIGWAIATWTLVCNYMALKHAHLLSSRRAFWATLLPLMMLALLSLALGGTVVVLGLVLIGGQ